MGQGYLGVFWRLGETGGGLFWGSHLNFFGEKCPVGMASHPKEVRAGTT